MSKTLHNKDASNKKALIMAGGTGGHIFPGLALATELQSRGFVVEWLGTAAGMEARLIPQANINLHFIPVKGIRGKGFKSLLLAPWNILSSIISALNIIRQLKPDVVVGLGGFVAGPGGFAARMLGLPLVIHEQNAIPGTTNKLLAHIATKVLTAFPTPLKKSQCIGNPVRVDIENLPVPEKRFANQESETHLLVLGGSRGALAINDLVPAALNKVKDMFRFKVLHQAGAGKYDNTVANYERAGVKATVVEFIDDMANAYSWSHMVVCRSGALTVSELAAAGLPSILIPFPYAIDDHQTANAEYLSSFGAAVIKQQSELTEEGLAVLFEELLGKPEKLKNMAIKARELAKPRAAASMADVCEEVLNV